MAIQFPDWGMERNILCVRPDNMGDVLMTMPAIRALKQSAKGRKVTLLTSTAGAAIVRMIPEIDDVITFDVPWVKNNVIHNAQQITAVAERLRERQFDAAVIFTVYSQSPLPTAMLCYLAGIPKVLGYCHENPYQLINHWIPDLEPFEGVHHEVERQLRLVATVGAHTNDERLRLLVSAAARQTVQQKLGEWVGDSKKWLVLHAGVSEEKRRYSADSFAAAMQTLSEYGYKILLTGSPAEHSYTAQLAKMIGGSARNIAGKLSLEDLVALIAEAPVLVSNNTGPVHIAAAVQTPVVVLYAMTNPQHTPWQVPSRVLYFPVPKELRSKNRFLQDYPGTATPQASPAGIVEAVMELV